MSTSVIFYYFLTVKASSQEHEL